MIYNVKFANLPMGIPVKEEALLSVGSVNNSKLKNSREGGKTGNFDHQRLKITAFPAKTGF
jgi:hypothetical protein